jgi:hypothetical protein
VACPTASTCYGVGWTINAAGGSGGGIVATISDGVPGPAVSVPDTYNLDDIACTTVSSCVAVATSWDPKVPLQYARLVPITDGAPGPSVPVVDALGFHAVACATPRNCHAVGRAQDVYQPFPTPGLYLASGAITPFLFNPGV